ncbi:cyclic nucleotide-binding domain-containing protein [Myxococcota bacterium]|nr:cyclic nucleotide-binding domain-containing protein [Myxococcota bacterium]
MNEEKRNLIQDALLTTFVFESLTPQEITELTDTVWIEDFPEGTVIVQEGDLADALYIVVKGGIHVTKRDGQFLSYLGKGGFFGEMALFTEGSLRSATCTSGTETECVVVRKEDLDDFCTRNSAVGIKIYRAIIRTLAERLQITSADLAVLMAAGVKSQSGVSDAVARAKAKKKAKQEAQKAAAQQAKDEATASE